VLLFDWVERSQVLLLNRVVKVLLACVAVAGCSKTGVAPVTGVDKASSTQAALHQTKGTGPTPEALFARLDANRDSQLSAFEYSRIPVGRPVGASPEPQQGVDLEALTYLFQAYDASKNGLLDINEFKAVLARMLKKPIGPGGVFEHLDVNQDGVLSFAELYLGHWGQPSGGWSRDQQRLQVMKMLVSADANGDGVLSQEEFKSGTGHSGVGVEPVQGS
jgi:hypothetical protein